jgi:protein TonB
VSQGDVTKNQVDSSDPQLNPTQEHAAEDRTKFPSPPGESAARGAKPWPEGPDEGEGVPDIAEQAAIPPTQQLDAATLSSQLEGQLRNALAPYFTYPLMARRNGWEGQVQVGLRVEADGRLSHVRIAHSSGYRALDSAALTTLDRINALPEAAGWLDGRHFDMVLPIEYRLIDGQS